MIPGPGSPAPLGSPAHSLPSTLMIPGSRSPAPAREAPPIPCLRRLSQDLEVPPIPCLRRRTWKPRPRTGSSAHSQPSTLMIPGPGSPTSHGKPLPLAQRPCSSSLRLQGEAVGFFVREEEGGQGGKAADGRSEAALAAAEGRPCPALLSLGAPLALLASFHTFILEKKEEKQQQRPRRRSRGKEREIEVNRFFAFLVINPTDNADKYAFYPNRDDVGSFLRVPVKISKIFRGLLEIMLLPLILNQIKLFHYIYIKENQAGFMSYNCLYCMTASCHPQLSLMIIAWSAFRVSDGLE
ncbi:hypothetical protein JD844_005421 [Phrynosoma platyrhinos]|uniref:Uncharacterized protein n=1 Tax=Phrynosoma platyrhinos TaxID=52577 RepID=A0ABQ7TNY5_PHRPL|nr:hypothetical protein JD844_005421 [Phrynosoma platyrhinos]